MSALDPWNGCGQLLGSAEPGTQNAISSEEQYSTQLNLSFAAGSYALPIDPFYCFTILFDFVNLNPKRNR